MWIFRFSLRVCSTELRNLVSSLEHLVYNGRQVLVGDIRLCGSTTNNEQDMDEGGAHDQEEKKTQDLIRSQPSQM